MSRQKLKGFLEKLEKEMYRRDPTYRREADKREMTFFYNPKKLADELQKEFAFRGLLEVFGKKDVTNFIATGAANILADCRTQAKKFKATRGVLIRSNQYAIKVTLAVEKNPKTDKNFSNFNKLKTLYKDSLNKFVMDLNEFLKKNHETKLTKTQAGYYDKEKKEYIRKVINTDKEIEYGSDLIEAGHLEGEGIAESRARDAIDKAINESYTSAANKEVLESNMDALGIDMGFIRDDTTDKHTIYAQSRVENQQTGFLSGDEKRKFAKNLRKAIERLEQSTPIKGLKGSDSIEELKVKQATHAIMKEYEAKPNIKTSPKTKKPKLTKRQAVSEGNTKKSIKTNSTIAKTKVAKAGLRKRKPKKRKGPSSSPLHLIGIINKELPNTVRKNMGPPALENVTGRFAESVRVTDITTTRKGFPSIGYTYAKNPYQVFEQGTGRPGWASPERDPRAIIDKSIREIAAQFAMGRFYTRRQ